MIDGLNAMNMVITIRTGMQTPVIEVGIIVRLLR